MANQMLDTAGQFGAGGAMVAMAYGVVRLYRRLFVDGQSAWDHRLNEIRRERDQDRSIWESDRTELRDQLELVNERLSQCHRDSMALMEQVGELKGRVAGLQAQMSLMRRDINEHGE